MPGEAIETLQRKLGEAREQGAVESEIAILVDIARAAVEQDDPGLANLHFDLAAKRIRHTRRSLDRLHEVLGERALVMRRAGRLDEALRLYREAAEAAEQHAEPSEHARWVGKQSAIYRLMGERDQARAMYERAREMFEALGERGLSGVADQEGNLGLLAHDAGDDDAAEAAYRRAYEMASTARAWGLAATWAGNLGNALSRRRRYREAWGCYEKALEWASLDGNERAVLEWAEQWAVSYRRAHRSRDAAETLLRAAGAVRKPGFRVRLLETSLYDLKLAGQWQRLLQVATELTRRLEAGGADAVRLRRCREDLVLARKRLAGRAAPGGRARSGPAALEDYVLTSMAHFEATKNTEGMAEVAHLICDVALGLQDPAEDAWSGLLDNGFLRFRVLGDAMKALCRAEMPEKSLELSQRFKSLGFALPNIQRVRETGDLSDAARGYLGALSRLRDAVGALRGPVADDAQERVEAVRAAGEELLECGELLRERDPALHARLGGLVRPRDLLTCLPVSSPVGIVDLFVCHDSTVSHLLVREGNAVRVVGVLSSGFSAAQARDLLEAWARGYIWGEISERQRQALIEIGKTLHDRLMCGLASELARLRVTQAVLIPDVLTRHLPLHLALVCAKNLAEIIHGIRMRKRPRDATFFADVFPVEYAPCLQAVAASAPQKRPRDLRTVLAIADPKSNLPGARFQARWLEERLSGTLECRVHTGSAATRANLFADLGRANIVVIGSHGHFDSSAPDDSNLELYDGPWKMAEMIEQRALASSPVVVLSACEVGATAPTLDELAASGIPGALISAGAASVLATLWPVVDVAMGYLVERFLIHLSHRGFRPSAALFRALYDLRRLSRRDALARCRRLMREMEKDGTADREPETYIKLDNLVSVIRDSDRPHPFDSPQYWGGVVIFGCGWHSPAGAMVGGVPELMAAVQAALRGREVGQLLGSGRFGEARRILEELLPRQEGVARAVALEMLARAVWGGRPKGADAAARHEAEALLAEAAAIAKAEEDRATQRRIRATLQGLGRKGRRYV